MILIFLVAGLAVSVGYLRLTPPAYTARADVYLSIVGVQNVSELSAAAAFSQQQARSFSIMANRQGVLDPVIAQLQLSETPDVLGRSIRATVPANTSLITIEVTRDSPQDAATIANAVATSLADTAAKLLPPAKRGAPAVSLQTVQRAQPPAEPSSPNVLAVTLVGVVGGLGVGIALALLIDAIRRSGGTGRVAPTSAARAVVPDNRAAVPEGT